MKELRIQESKGYRKGAEKDARRRLMTRGESSIPFKAARAQRIALNKKRARAAESE